MKQILAALLAMLLLAGCTPTQEPSSPASEPESQSSSSAPDSGEPASESVPEDPGPADQRQCGCRWRSDRLQCLARCPGYGADHP